MPPLKIFGQGEAIAKGFKALDLRTAPMPMAVTSIEYKDRPACIYDGWCDAGCPIGALVNPVVLHIPQAKDAGAQFMARARVTRVIMKNKRRAQGVEYVDAAGTRFVQQARLIVLAASVAHVPQILLNSATDDHPHGLGNATDQVGRAIMTHPLIPVFGLFQEETEPHLGVTAAQLTSRDGYQKNARAGLFGSYQWLIAPTMKPNDLPGLGIGRPDIFGRKLDAFMRRAAKHGGNMLAMSEELPDPDNRVVLAAREGPLNTREPRFVHGFSAEALALVAHVKSEGRRIFEAAGAEEIGVGGPNSAHLMGGTPMGTDPTTSVTDEFGRIHDLDNVMIAGPGLFPTSGAVNPTYTMLAVTDRQAMHWHRTL
jgi:choline dehydrogenase-like flavoprotein